MKRIFFAFIVLGFGVSLWAQGKALTASADPWPPFVDNNNPTDGLSLEIIRAAFQTQGYTVNMTYTPWARAEADVAKGVIDILPDTWMTEDQAKILVYSDPYAKNALKFIKRKGDPFEYTGIESLKGKEVGIIKDYGYEDTFIKSDLFKKEEVPDLMTNIKKLLANHIDLTLEDPIVATFIMKSVDPTLLSKVEFTKNDLSTVPLYLCVGKNNPRQNEIIEAFNKGLLAIKADGTYKRLFSKYGISE
jgi:polar amino acid transport system substrate-binding protein